jgi:hypothetical protein
MTDSLDIPEFLLIPQEQRNAYWKQHPPKPMPKFGRQLTETEILYNESIEADKARKRAADEVRFAELRARKAAEKAERDAIKQAIKGRKQ